jgi:hypothetical protein
MSDNRQLTVFLKNKNLKRLLKRITIESLITQREYIRILKNADLLGMIL